MTARDPGSERRDCGGDAAAFVLGALERSEADAFREHMASCVVCRDEVASFQQAVDVLPMAAPQYEVPRGLRRRVLSAVRSEARPAPASARRGRRQRLRWLTAAPRPALGMGAAVLAAVALFGGVELAGSGPSGSRIVSAQVAGPGSAQLKISHGRGELILHGVAPPPAGHVYEVWLQRGAAPPSPTSALFSVTSAGAGDVGVPGSLRGVRQILVTPEPTGGSLVPTHSPVVVARVS
jgi:anti-sigma-K factor RskA